MESSDMFKRDCLSIIGSLIYIAKSTPKCRVLCASDNSCNEQGRGEPIACLGKLDYESPSFGIVHFLGKKPSVKRLGPEISWRDTKSPEETQHFERHQEKIVQRHHPISGQLPDRTQSS